MAGIQSSQLVFAHIAKKVKISDALNPRGLGVQWKKKFNLMWKNY